MKMRLLTSALLVLLLILAGSIGYGRAETGKASAPGNSQVEAEVLSIRRYSMGMYLYVQRDDGGYEWLQIPDSQGLEVAVGGRVVYYAGHRAHWSDYLGGMLRSGGAVALAEAQHDDRVFRAKGRDGSIIFTDNPTRQMQTEKKKAQTPAAKGDDSGMQVVTQEQLLKEEEFYDRYNSEMEERRGYSTRNSRKAKR